MPRMEHEMKKRLGRWRKPTTAALAVVVIGGVGFYGGMTYQKHHTTASGNNASTQTANSQGFGGNGNFSGGSGGFGGSRADRVIGQVTAISSTSITVQDQSGSSTTLAITSSTTITDNGQTVAASDIQSGDTVFITEDSSNTSQASRIMVNPSFGGAPSSSSSQSSTNAQSD